MTRGARRGDDVSWRDREVLRGGIEEPSLSLTRMLDRVSAPASPRDQTDQRSDCRLGPHQGAYLAVVGAERGGDGVGAFAPLSWSDRAKPSFMPVTPSTARTFDPTAPDQPGKRHRRAQPHWRR
jgi:hypothetical protein